MSEKNVSKIIAAKIISKCSNDLIRNAGTVYQKAMSEILQWVLEEKCDFNSIEHDYEGLKDNYYDYFKDSTKVKLALDFLEDRPFDSYVLETFRLSTERRSVIFDYLSDKTIKHLYTTLTIGLAKELETMKKYENLIRKMEEYFYENDIKSNYFDGFFDSFLVGVFFAVFLGIIFNLILQFF